MRCPYCGQQNKARAKKCSHCGRSTKLARSRIRTYIFGVILIALILGAGLFALRIAARGLEGSLLGSGNSILETAAKAEAEAKRNAELAAAEEAEAAELKEEVVEEPEETPVPLGGTLTDDKSVIDLSGYAPCAVASVEASTVLAARDGSNAYAGESAFDGVERSSWQEGEPEEGLGATLTAHLDRSYTIRYILLKLGNWRSEKAYVENNRPESMTVTIGEASFSITFPDEQVEHCITLSEDVETDSVSFRLDSAYPGSRNNDTCIADIVINGF